MMTMNTFYVKIKGIATGENCNQNAMIGRPITLHFLHSNFILQSRFKYFQTFSSIILYLI